MTNLLFGQEQEQEQVQTSLNMTDLPASTDWEGEKITARRIAEEDLSEAPIAVRSV